MPLPACRGSLERAFPTKAIEVVGAVPEVPEEMLVPGAWVRAIIGAWRESEVIHLLEGRVLLWGLRRSSRGAACHGKQILSLSDNLSDVLAFERGRSVNWGVRMQTRKSAAIQLATEIQWRVRHVRTGRNLTDHDSRAADRGELEPGQALHGPSRAVREFVEPSCRRVLCLASLVAPPRPRRALVLAELVEPPSEPRKGGGCYLVV